VRRRLLSGAPKAHAYSFLGRMLKYRQDRAPFATFDSLVKLHQDLTSRLDLPTKAIDKVKAQGGTRVCYVIYSICEEEMMAPASDII